MSSSIGKIFKLTTFGESHGIAIGGVLEGCPSGFNVDFDHIQDFLDKRKPGTKTIYSQRKETDKVEFLSGFFEGSTLGTPIGFMIRNSDQKSEDYDSLQKVFRPSHADYTYYQKYGIRDYRGGGRSSARETANWVVAGAIASQILKLKGVSIYSYVRSVADITLSTHYSDLDLNSTYNNDVRCPDSKVANKMKEKINLCKKNGDTIGGQIFTIIKGLPVGLGEPVFNKINASISRAIMSINACKGIAFGSGFSSTYRKGSEENDIFIKNADKLTTSTNNSGGIQGGISNGEDICFYSAFKPISTIMKTQKTTDIEGNTIDFEPSGRHDPCVLPRVVPVVSALSAMVVLDHYLLNQTVKISNL